MLNLLYVIVLAAILVCPVSARETPSQTDNENIGLTRSRILFGYSGVYMHDEEPMFRNVFFNFNYRTSGFDQFSKPFRVKWTFEIGLNVATGIEKNNDYGGIIIPYAKTGPEMSLAKNIFIGGSMGLAAAVWAYFGVLPFAGVNSYYLLPVNNNLYVEFEFGFHTTFFSYKAPYLFYFSSGIAIK